MCWQCKISGPNSFNPSKTPVSILLLWLRFSAVTWFLCWVCYATSLMYTFQVHSSSWSVSRLHASGSISWLHCWALCSWLHLLVCPSCLCHFWSCYFSCILLPTSDHDLHMGAMTYKLHCSKIHTFLQRLRGNTRDPLDSASQSSQCQTSCGHSQAGLLYVEIWLLLDDSFFLTSNNHNKKCPSATLISIFMTRTTLEQIVLEEFLSATSLSACFQII